MPLQNGKDKKGHFFRWGKTGKKYYYRTKEERLLAKRKALKQGYAIEYLRGR
jgi:hypothetical protein